MEAGRTALWMVQAHPHQQVYFSFLPAATATSLFDRDYWRLSYRAGLEWILKHDSAPQVTVSSPWPDMVYANSLILPADQRRRLRIVYDTVPGIQYFITSCGSYAPCYSKNLGREVHTIYVGGLPVLSVNQL
jgi:hypothetical protein